MPACGWVPAALASGRAPAVAAHVWACRFGRRPEPTNGRPSSPPVITGRDTPRNTRDPDGPVRSTGRQLVPPQPHRGCFSPTGRLPPTQVRTMRPRVRQPACRPGLAATGYPPDLRPPTSHNPKKHPLPKTEGRLLTTRQTDFRAAAKRDVYRSPATSAKANLST